jgi:hypothetical protein
MSLTRAREVASLHRYRPEADLSLSRVEQQRVAAERQIAADVDGTNTLFVSLLASCQLHGIEPWACLRDLLCVLPLLELAPAFWKQTREHEDAQQRLAANVFRAVTLADHAPPM